MCPGREPPATRGPAVERCPRSTRPLTSGLVRGSTAPRLWILCLLPLACGPSQGAGDASAPAPEPEEAWRGSVLAKPLDRPDFTLTDTSGEPFDFRRRTAGRVTLLFFGYTHCPDVCPIHMANLAAVLDDLGWQAREEVQVVFVTTDPARDTPRRIRTWLDRFDPAFVGLRGTRAEVEAIQRSLRLPASVIAGPATGDYAVGHAAQVVAFSADGPARIVYPFGIRQADWAHDLPLLIAGAEPERPEGRG